MAQDAIAQRLVVGLAGPRLTQAEKQWLDHWQPFGVILFARNCTVLSAWKRLIAELREVLPPGSELCADHEGGPVSFLQALAGRPPAPRTLGELDDVRLTRRVHRQTAERLHDLGLDRVLAPCCDVLREVCNPVIGSRSFGSEPDVVARHAVAAVEGLASGGIKCCAKHWPGHGDTRVDTHDMGAGASEPATGAWEASVDQQPFRAALAAGADALMIGHLPVCAGRPPCTLDAGALTDLRSALDSPTLLYSDDVSMGALRGPLASVGVTAADARTSGMVDPADLTTDWLRAVAETGCDRLLLRGIPWRALPLPQGEKDAPPGESPSGLDLRLTGPPSRVYAEARQRAAGSIALRHGGTRLLWFDTTSGDRLGEAASLAPVIDVWWPGTVRVDAAAHKTSSADAAVGGPESRESFARMLVTAHRPLTAAQAGRLRELAATKGVALAAGHPSLASALRRVLGPDWQVDALYDCAEPDLSLLAPLAAVRSSRSVDSP